MSQTTVPAGSALARKLYSVALFAQTQKATGLTKNLTGPAPQQGAAEAKLKGQSAADMPIVQVTDLSKTAGDTVSVDMFGIIGGKPIMGDTNAEGRGESLTSSTQDISINLTTKVVDAGGKMAQQRTIHELRPVAMSNLVSYFARLADQRALVHMAGARGYQNDSDWVLPLATDGDFNSIMVNAVKAPTYNRHFVCDGALLNNNSQLAEGSDIATTDVLTLEHIDLLRTVIDEMTFPLQPVKINDDPAAADEPMYVLYVSPRQYAQLLTSTASTSIRAFQQNAWNRASYGSKHPLFKGEVGMWNGILVKKLPRSIRFTSGSNVQINTLVNAGTATESTVVLDAGVSAGYAVDRAVLLGAQALGMVYGRHKSSDYYFSWYERDYNFERATEIAGDCMGGLAKLRFNYEETVGAVTPTDHGVVVLDSVVKL